MIGYLDCSSGISGDKFLGALIGCGYPLEELRRVLRRLDIRVDVSTERVMRAGVSGLHVLVTSDDDRPRSWREIHNLLAHAALPEGVAADAVGTFTLLAEAEGDVHDVPAEEVHFHELGAADSIADIVGTCAGLRWLEVERLHASRVAVGSGTVETEHGELPVPAPATSLLLRAALVEGGGEGELTTPTGAALLGRFVHSYGPMPPISLAEVGRGAGTRETRRPNVATLYLGEPDEPFRQGLQAVVELTTNVDHVSPEHLAFAAERLREKGALDVWQTPAVMKKGRAATILHALVQPSDAMRLAEEISRQTGSLGVRLTDVGRVVVQRESREVTTSLGNVRVKNARIGERVVSRPEADDIARIARERDMTFDEVAKLLAEETGAASED